MQKGPFCRRAALGLFIAMAVLLVVTAWGHGRLHDAAPEARYEVRSLDALLVRARSENWDTLSEAQKMAALFKAVTERFDHGPSLHSFSSNWILWTLGKILPIDIGVARDPDVVLRTQGNVLCSESSYVLTQAALREGILARHVGLNGHVVMEAYYDGGWHLYDPDYDVYSEKNSVAALEKSTSLVWALYKKEAETLLRYYQSAEDNTFMSVPRGAEFNMYAHILLWNERLCETLKFALPLLVMAAIIWCRGRSCKK
jgi:hypothetical protein